MILTNDHIRRINRGDVRAFKEIYENMFKSLCLFAYQMFPDKETIHDVVQEAFVVMWNNRKKLDSLAETKGYLYKIVHNKTIKAFNKKKKESEATKSYSDWRELGSFVTKEETYKLLHEAIAELPKQMKNVISLSMNACSNAEISEELSISVNTVKTLKKMGYSKLREQLKDNIFALVLLTGLY